MKNIHVLPTDKPSRLSKDENDRIWLSINFEYGINDNNKQNIYITSDEEIKEGDWCLYLGLSMTWFKLIEIDDYKLYWGSREYFNKNLCKKIILTTDQDLIKDGVQAIDDDFLEWFVKNPSCENVLVTNLYGDYNPIEYFYEIIIPKKEVLLQSSIDGEVIWGEEQKQHLINMMKADEELGLYEEPKQTDEKGKPMTYWGGLEKHKQETLEEAYYRIYKSIDFTEFDFASFTIGAKWQAERMYSEEELLQILESHKDVLEFDKDRFDHDKWFKQFKKK